MTKFVDVLICEEFSSVFSAVLLLTLQRFLRKNVILLNFIFDGISCASSVSEGDGTENNLCVYFLSMFVAVSLVAAVLVKMRSV